MSLLSPNNFSNLVDAVELKSALDDIANRHGQPSRQNNINGAHTDFLSGYNKKLIIITSGKSAFGSTMIPANSALTSSKNILPGTILTYEKTGQKIHGIVAKNQGKNSMFLTVDQLDEEKYQNFLESNHITREVVLTPQDITTSKQVQKQLQSLKPNLLTILFQILFNWWIPDLDTEGSTFIIIIRFLLGMGVYFVIIYASLYFINQYL